MTINAKLKTLLDTFGYPVEHMTLDRSATTYFTFNEADNRGAAYADDAPGVVLVSVQVQFFCPSSFNYKTLVKSVRDALFAAGFTFPTITELYESDTKLNHIVFEFETTEEQ